MLNVCSNHFISSRPSKLHVTCDPDWAPSTNVGYSPHNGNTSGIERFNRRKRRREFLIHQQQAEIDSKMKKDVEKRIQLVAATYSHKVKKVFKQVKNYLTQLDIKQNLILTK